jgi:uncharacterized protein YndB with AHSA1/START domain
MTLDDVAITRCELDVRVGGAFRLDMQSKGKTFDHTGRYLEIEAPARLRLTWISEGSARRESIVTIELRELDGGAATELVLTHEALPNAEMVKKHSEGWGAFLEGLARSFEGVAGGGAATTSAATAGGSAFLLDEAKALLERTPALLDAWLRGLPDCWLACDEGPETWSPLVVVGHLIHGEKTDWIPRARRILEHGESLAFEPFDRFAQLNDRGGQRGRSLDQQLDEFAALRRRSLDELEELALTPALLQKKGRHPELGTVTLAQLLATWVAHDLDHLQQIARVMAKRYVTEAGPWTAYLRILSS